MRISCVRPTNRITCHLEASVLFVEVKLSDASLQRGAVRRRRRGGRSSRAAMSSPAIPNAIAALLLFIRDETHRILTRISAGRKATLLRIS
jgi:hypothetical protein